MPKASPGYVAFNAGELSPLMAGRVDQAKYATGLETCENWIPTIQGPIRRTPGRRFVKEVKDSAARCWLQRFQFSVGQAYALEFGDGYIRFYTQHGRLEDGGEPYEVVTPYAVEDLTDSDGACRLRVAQSGDVLYVALKGYPLHKLSRLGALDWTFAEVDHKGGPWADMNLDDGVTVYASGETGTVTLQASADIFAASDVGSLFWLEQAGPGATSTWTVGAAIAVGDPSGKVRYGGNYYQAVEVDSGAHQTGTAPPVHLEGDARDGSIGGDWVTWRYLHSGYGWVRITGFTDANTATAEVLSRLPENVVGSGNATSKWRFGAFSATRGWPQDVAFFRERLVLVGGLYLHFSVAGDFENFEPKTGPDQLADNAITIRVATGGNDEVKWLSPSDALLIGTGGGELVLREMTTTEVFGPKNVTVVAQTAYGSRGVVPIKAGRGTLFVPRAGRKLRELSYSADVDGLQAPDLTRLSDHIARGGMLQLDWQQEPDSIVWAVRADGMLLGFTYNAEEQVYAWHRHPYSGGATESVCVLPTPDGSADELWCIVRRTINGQTKRYVEFVEQGYDGGAIEDAFYVDSGLTYDGVATLSLSGLGHLEGKTVAVLGDGAVQPQQVVTGGAITLHRAASKVQVGLPYRSIARTMRIEAGAGDGTAQGKTKKIARVIVRLLEALGLRAGPDAEHADLVTFRAAADPMGAPVPLVTGDRRFDWPAGLETEGQMTFLVEQPVPATIIAAFPQMDTRDR